MTQKIAVLILHGAGTPERDFAKQMIRRIAKGFSKKTKAHKSELVFEPVFWSSIFAGGQEELWDNLQCEELHYQRLRKFAVDFLADAVAYQPTDKGGQNYDQVHSLLAKSIGKLKDQAGENAPLCVISHSLGSIVASNYFFDLQYRRSNIGIETRLETSKTPIEQSKTLALFYTMGSPMALWSMRYIDFGSPVSVPSPGLEEIYPTLQGEWLNFYDKDDVLSYPLKNINKAYNQAVTRDVCVRAGGLLTGWNPLSHIKYDTDKEVIRLIVDGLSRTWKTVNQSR